MKKCIRLAEQLLWEIEKQTRFVPFIGVYHLLMWLEYA